MLQLKLTIRHRIEHSRIRKAQRWVVNPSPALAQDDSGHGRPQKRSTIRTVPTHSTTARYSIVMTQLATGSTVVALRPAPAPVSEAAGVSDDRLTQVALPDSLAQDQPLPREVCTIRGRTSRVRGHAEIVDDDDDDNNTAARPSLVMRLRWTGNHWYVLPFTK